MHKPPVKPIFLSPHLDDAALSCGGLIHQQAQQGIRPLVITCFAGVPDYCVLSPFAAWQHQRWGEVRDPVGLRRKEDAMAMACLCAEYEHWDYLDCIYRCHPVTGEFFYTAEEALFGPIASEELYLIDELVARLKITLSIESTHLYAPLAVGQHVDHQIVFQVALQLRRLGFTMQYYEDYPYAEDSESLASALGSWLSPPSSFVLALSEEDIEVKIAAIRHYRSQLAMLFGDEFAMAKRVKTRALAVGAGHGYGERYWQGGIKERRDA
nr:PIG-L family deacetylase [Chloroflexota bacterium]